MQKLEGVLVPVVVNVILERAEGRQSVRRIKEGNWNSHESTEAGEITFDTSVKLSATRKL